MTIEQIDGAKVLIALGSQDMEDYSLEFESMSFKNPHSRKILSRLLKLVCSKTGLTMENRSMLVEALPYQKGCLILVTFVERNRKRKKYKIKKPKECVCFSFGDIETLLKTISLLYKARLCLHTSKVYLYGGRYYLVFDFMPLPQKAKHILNEYACVHKSTKIFLAKLKEAGKTVCEEKAVETMGKAFSR